LAKIDSENIIATDFSGTTEASQLAINEIGEVNIKYKAIYFDAYNDNKSNGAFILMMQQYNCWSRVYKIDPHSSFP
jgi:sulfate adenylyltransferase subunit 1